jgi:hypothetical protein
MSVATSSSTKNGFSFGPRHHGRRELRGQRLRQGVGEHQARRLRRQRLEEDRLRVGSPRAPSGSLVDELRTSRREHEERAAGIAHDPLQEIQERLFRPVDVLDEQDERLVGG